MKIAIAGFGKMGHMIKNAAENLGHEIVLTADPAAQDADTKIIAGDKASIANAVKSSGAEGIIEFSHPSAVMTNIEALLPLGIPLVVGTTGWNSEKQNVEKLAADCAGIIMSSSNFSIGVNIFFKVIEETVKLIQPFSEYDIASWEMHHNQKADSPSGTAMEIARRILKEDASKTEIETGSFSSKPNNNQLHVSSTRCGFVPGTHTVFFDSPADTLELTHRARSREGFAIGAVHALERLSEGIKNGTLKRGKLYGMEDLF